MPSFFVEDYGGNDLGDIRPKLRQAHVRLTT